MGFFFPKKASKEIAELNAEVQRPGYIRTPLMVLLIILMVVLYWRSFSSKLTDIEAQSFFKDETGVWSVEDKRALSLRAGLFHEQWGMRVLAQVSLEAPVLPELSGNTLFIGVSAGNNQALIVLPSLAARAYQDLSRQAGYDLRLAVQDELAACMAESGNSVQCIYAALDSISKTLTTY